MELVGCWLVGWWEENSERVAGQRLAFKRSQPPHHRKVEGNPTTHSMADVLPQNTACVEVAG